MAFGELLAGCTNHPGRQWLRPHFSGSATTPEGRVLFMPSREHVGSCRRAAAPSSWKPHAVRDLSAHMRADQRHLGIRETPIYANVNESPPFVAGAAIVPAVHAVLAAAPPYWGGQRRGHVAQCSPPRSAAGRRHRSRLPPPRRHSDRDMGALVGVFPQASRHPGVVRGCSMRGPLNLSSMTSSTKCSYSAPPGAPRSFPSRQPSSAR